MQIFGELIKDNIIIKNPKDVGRLYNKSNFGKPISGNKLELDLLEGIFLLEEGKILIKRCEINAWSSGNTTLIEFCFQIVFFFFFFLYTLSSVRRLFLILML